MVAVAETGSCEVCAGRCQCRCEAVKHDGDGRARWLVLYRSIAGSGAVQGSSSAGSWRCNKDRRRSERRRRLKSCFNARVELVAFLLGVE